MGKRDIKKETKNTLFVCTMCTMIMHVLYYLGSISTMNTKTWTFRRGREKAILEIEIHAPLQLYTIHFYCNLPVKLGMVKSDSGLKCLMKNSTLIGRKCHTLKFLKIVCNCEKFRTRGCISSSTGYKLSFDQ